ncbi:hypothetical protein B0H13DRAFT_2270067 [Mycena leptocephala]|nr:hypothetical protein B0H13DRAFT_2270067 [Mycena leptocephala]
MVPLAVGVNVLTVVLSSSFPSGSSLPHSAPVSSSSSSRHRADADSRLGAALLRPLLSLFGIIADVYDEAIAFWGALFKRVCQQVARDASLNQAWCLPLPIPPRLALVPIHSSPPRSPPLFVSPCSGLLYVLSLRFPATAAFWTHVGFRRLSSQTLLHIKGLAISSWARTSSLGLDFFRIIDALEMEFWSIIDQGFCLALRHLNLDRFKTRFSEIYSSWIFAAASTAFLAYHLPALALAGSSPSGKRTSSSSSSSLASSMQDSSSALPPCMSYVLATFQLCDRTRGGLDFGVCGDVVLRLGCFGGARPSPDPSLHQRVLGMHSGAHVIKAPPPAAADPEPAQRSNPAPAQRPTAPQAHLAPTPSSLSQAAVQLSRPPNPAPSSSDSSSGSDWDSDYDLDDYEFPDNHEYPNYEQFPGRYNSPDNHNYVEPPDNDWTPVLSRRALVGQLSPILEVSSVASMSSMSALAMSESESEFESTTPPVSPLRAKVTQAFLSPRAALTQASLSPRPLHQRHELALTRRKRAAGRRSTRVLQVDKAPAREIQLCTPAREVRQVPKARAQRDMAAFRSFSAALNLHGAEDAEDLQSNGAVGLSGDGGECDIKRRTRGVVEGGSALKLEFDPSKVEFERPVVRTVDRFIVRASPVFEELFHQLFTNSFNFFHTFPR